MAWNVSIGGSDITGYCQEIKWRPRLSRPASCTVRFPAHLFSGISPGVSELQLSSGGLLFSGPCWYPQDDGDENATYTEVTAYDHLIYLNKRLCKTPADWPDNDWPEVSPPTEPGPCNLADPSKVLTDFVTAPEILAAFINATNDCDPGGYQLSVASAAGGGADMTGVPADWPMNLLDMAEMLLSTGQLNILVNPGSGSSSLTLTNGGVVNDLSGSVVLQYGTGAFNSRGANRTRDMEEVTNALWYLLGPKRPFYDGDISHWAGSITPTAPHRDDPENPDDEEDDWPGDLVARWEGSRGTYGYMQEIQVHDTAEDEQVNARPLFEEMYANEAYLRAVPRTFTGIRPNRFTSAPSFRPGDLIGVQAGSMLGGGYSGSVLVYEYEVTVDADGIAEFTDMLTSADSL